MNPVDPARSAEMALVRGRDTKPEMRVRKALHAAGLRSDFMIGACPASPTWCFQADV
jgi:DNA mismatch endonuclease (patch repair protein)